MHIDGPIEDLKVTIRNLEEKLFTAFDSPGGARQREQDFVFDGRQSQWVSAY